MQATYARLMFPGSTSSSGQGLRTPATPDQTTDSDQKSSGPMRPLVYQSGSCSPHREKEVGAAALSSAASSCYHSPAGSEAGCDASCDDVSSAQRSHLLRSHTAPSWAASGSQARASLPGAAGIKVLHSSGAKEQQPVPAQHRGSDIALADAAAVPAGEQSALYLPTSEIGRTSARGDGSMQIGRSDYRVFLDAITAARQEKRSPQRAQQPDADQQSTPAAVQRALSSELYAA